jgi:hypothetical protein
MSLNRPFWNAPITGERTWAHVASYSTIIVWPPVSLQVDNQNSGWNKSTTPYKQPFPSRSTKMFRLLTITHLFDGLRQRILLLSIIKPAFRALQIHYLELPWMISWSKKRVCVVYQPRSPQCGVAMIVKRSLKFKSWHLRIWKMHLICCEPP